MFRTKSLISTLIVLSLAVGGVASGDCIDDGNNDAGTARTIGYTESVSDVVCPDDPFDYFTFETAGAMKANGLIQVESEQTGTTLRISRGSDIIFEKATTVLETAVTYTMPSESIGDGEYYLRIGFYSDYPYDHEYVLTLDLTVASATITVDEHAPGEGAHDYVIKEEEFTAVMPEVHKLSSSPWPMHCGDAMHRSRSTFAGPSDKGYLIVSKDLDVVPQNPYLPGEKKYIGLIAGDDDWVYFLDAKSMNLVMYNIIKGFAAAEYIQLGSTKPICLDKGGTMYYVQQDKLVSLDSPTVRTNWAEALPKGVSKNVMAAGSRIYTSVEGYQDSVQAWLASGVQSLDIEVDAPVLGIAEGGLGAYFYVLTGESLCKYDKQGGELWRADLPEPKWFTPANMEIFGPIIGADGRVWVNDDTKPYWRVFNADGTEYKNGYWWDGLLPAAAAIDADGRLILALNNREVVFYDDWDDSRLVFELPGNPVDVIVDGDGTTYMCYLNEEESEYLFKLVLDDPYLTTVSDIRTGIPSDLVDEEYDVEMAIVGGGRIAFLHEMGYLTVIQNSPLMTKINVGDILNKAMSKADIPPGLEDRQEKQIRPGRPACPLTARNPG